MELQMTPKLQYYIGPRIEKQISHNDHNSRGIEAGSLLPAPFKVLPHSAKF